MTVSERILQSVLYADIFQHPLTEREVWKWIPTGALIAKKAFRRELQDLVRQKLVAAVSPFVILPKHKQYIGIHAVRLMTSQKKWKLAHSVARALRAVPTILFVGVTGSLAMNNAKEQDDIDFCIVASRGTVWITRLLTTVIVELCFHRRHPNTTNVRDTICLNMFLSENTLVMDKAHQDVYIAHELLQMVPLWERKGIEKKLLRANAWVKLQYAHAYEEKMKQSVHRLPQLAFWETLFRIFERPVMRLQLQYMARRRTIEDVREDQIRFHPTDIRHKVIATYQSACKSYKIPLDKVLI